MTLIGIAVLGAVAVYQARPYLKVANEYPTAKRTIKEVETYSSGPAALLAASSENRVWGGVTSGARAKVHSKNESVFFPGGADPRARADRPGRRPASTRADCASALALGIVVVLDPRARASG